MSEYSLREELVPDSLRGFRSWSVGIDRGSWGARVGDPIYDSVPGHLKALHQRYTWQPGVNHARCLVMPHGYTCHGAPVGGCTCGFYATYRLSSCPSGLITGAIKATGRVIMGTRGFRAENAEVEALALRDAHRYAESDWRAISSKLADTYGVPVLDDWKELGERYPMADVTELVGPVPTLRDEWMASITDQSGWGLSRLDAEFLWDWAGCTEWNTILNFETIEIEDSEVGICTWRGYRGTVISPHRPGRVHMRSRSPLEWVV